MKNLSIKSGLIFIIILSCISILSSILFNLAYLGHIPRYEYLRIDSTVTEINSDDAYQLYETGKVIFIDSRSIEEYNTLHISGAVSLPYRSPREYKFEVMQKYDPMQMVVTYCNNSSCTLAERLRGQLNFMGYKRVVTYTDGLEEWRKKDYPVSKDLSDD